MGRKHVVCQTQLTNKSSFAYTALVIVLKNYNTIKQTDYFIFARYITFDGFCTNFVGFVYSMFFLKHTK